MNFGFPPQDLECPDPAGCTVAVTELQAFASQGLLPLVAFPQDRGWFRVYDSRDGHGQPNSGYGDTRFAPFDAVGTKNRVPTLYLAESLTAALLETSFHNVYEQKPRVISEMSLLGKLHARITPPTGLQLTDLRDSQLTRLGLNRKNIASSSAEHYPCTRKVARAIHASSAYTAGIVWHSRQAELNGMQGLEVVVVFADRIPQNHRAWNLAPHRNASGALLEGAGRILLDELAESLDVTISVSTDL